MFHLGLGITITDLIHTTHNSHFNMKTLKTLSVLFMFAIIAYVWRYQEPDRSWIIEHSEISDKDNFDHFEMLNNKYVAFVDSFIVNEGRFLKCYDSRKFKKMHYYNKVTSTFKDSCNKYFSLMYE